MEESAQQFTDSLTASGAETPSAEEVEAARAGWIALMEARASTKRSLESLEYQRRIASEHMMSLSGLPLEEALDMSDGELLRVTLRHSLAPQINELIDRYARLIEGEDTEGVA